MVGIRRGNKLRTFERRQERLDQYHDHDHCSVHPVALSSLPVIIAAIFEVSIRLSLSTGISLWVVRSRGGEALLQVTMRPSIKLRRSLSLNHDSTCLKQAHHLLPYLEHLECCPCPARIPPVYQPYREWREWNAHSGIERRVRLSIFPVSLPSSHTPTRHLNAKF